MDTFDFILDDETQQIDRPPTIPEYVGPNLNELVRTTRKKFGQDILSTYSRLGGPDWLWTQAQADPKAFFELLKKMIPNPTIADTIADITVKLINRYGEKMEIEARTHAVTPDSAPAAGGNGGSGQLIETATSGNLPNPRLIERYEDD